jgi:Na+/pantothenate symporter
VASIVQDGDYYIAPAFLDKFTVHIVKNYIDLPKIKVRCVAFAAFRETVTVGP